LSFLQSASAPTPVDGGTTGRVEPSEPVSAPPGRWPPSAPGRPDLGSPGRPSFPSTFPKGTNILGFFDFGFERFVTLAVVKVLWIVWLVLSLLGAAIFIMMGIWRAGVGEAIMVIVAVPLAWAIWTTLVRIWLELICVVFRISEDLRALRDAQKTSISLGNGVTRDHL
jgi:hypothetical protein